VGLRQAQGRPRGQKLPPRPLGAAVDRTMLVRIDFAPGPIHAVPVAGLRRRLHRDVVADAELLQVHALIAALDRGPCWNGQGDLVISSLR
jgi:hypothetical protein